MPDRNAKATLSRRSFLAASAGALAAASAAPNASTPSRPNFVIILADDLGYGDLGCYGNTVIQTPHIDALAASGVRFTDFHANGPVCSPTRAALLTGRYQQRCGVDGGVFTARGHRHTGMPLAEETFAEALAPFGYKTALFGKWHLGYPVEFNPVRQGFDAFRGYVSGNVDYHSHIDQEGYEDWWRGGKLKPDEGYVTDLITDYAEDFVRSNKDHPFCLYLAHEAPHYPYQGREDPAFRTTDDPSHSFGDAGQRKHAYREMVEAMDDSVGRVISLLGELGLRENTFVFFCSDNGATKVGSNAPLRGYKGSLWEGGHRVPAIASWPGTLEAGTRTNAAAMTMDLFPTLLHIAGEEGASGPQLDGVTLLPMLRDTAPVPERTLYWRFGQKKAVRRGDWKLMVNQDTIGGESRGPVRLFNLREDLGERHNVAGENPELAGELLQSLAVWEGEVTEGVTMLT